MWFFFMVAPLTTVCSRIAAGLLPLTSSADVNVSVCQQDYYQQKMEADFISQRWLKIIFQRSDGINVAMTPETFWSIWSLTAVAVVRQLGVLQCCQFSPVLTLLHYLLSKCLLISMLCFCPTRAAGELDGHQGDPAGGDGVQCQIPRNDPGGTAQRRGHGGDGHPQNRCHGE